MTNAFDPRIVRVGLQIENDFIVFEGLDIRIEGQKFFGPTMNACTVKISNLTRDQRNFILTKATPISFPNRPNRTPIYMTVDVGRESYGTFRLFEGEVYTSTVTPPPDIGIVLRSLTQSFATGIISSISLGATTQIETVAKEIASKNGLLLDFRAEPRQIANFSYTGPVSKLIDKLQMIGDVRACVNNRTLIVRDKDGFANEDPFVLSMETGMVGVPQATESGVTVQALVQPGLDLGRRASIKSQINPSVNGSDYNITQINFNICNRDNPFFYNLVLSNWAYIQGTQ